MARITDALGFCLQARHLRRSLATAAVVGTALTLINHADHILGGEATGATWVKVGLNFVVPFVVTNVGMLAGRAQGDS